MEDADRLELKKLIRHELRLALARKPKRIPICEDCGHRHRAGYCAEVCDECIEEES